MNRNYKSSHNVVALILLISLFLQSCGHSFNQLPHPEDKRSPLKEQVKSMSLLGKTLRAEKGYLVTFHEQDGRLRADIRADEKQPVPNYIGIPIVIEKETDLALLTRLNPKIQENRIQLKCNKYRRIAMVLIFNCGVSGGMMEDDNYPEKEEKKERNINDVKQLPDVRSRINQDVTEKPESYSHQNTHIEKMKFGEKRKREKEKQETSSVQIQDKRRKTGMNLITFFKAIPESNKARTAIKEEAKRVRKEKGKEWKEEEDQNEVLSNIFQHLPFKTRISLTETNTDLYKFFNDCQKTRLAGVDNINPSTRFDPYTIRNYCYSDFSEVKFMPAEIPSVPFCRIMQQVSDLPKSYWPYIDKTNIRVISLAATRIRNDNFIYLWECLQNSKVKEVNLSYNHITDEIANKIAGLPKPKSMSKVILSDNQLTEVGKNSLKAIYSDVTWIF